MQCKSTRELLEEYALDLLDAEQRARVAEHLAGCADCRARHGEYVELLDTLPATLAAVSPHALPPALKEKLLQRLDAETSAGSAISDSPSSPAVSTSPSAVSNGAPAASPSHASPTPNRSLERSESQERTRRLRWALVAASLLLVLSLTWSLRLSGVLARERALRADYVELVGQQQELVLEIVDSDRTIRRVLRSTSDESNAYGKVFTRTDMAYVVAMAARLPQPPSGEAYHLWLLRSDAPELAGVMRINEYGFALVIHQADAPDPQYERAYVTLQPQGSHAPQGDPVIAWQAEE